MHGVCSTVGCQIGHGRSDAKDERPAPTNVHTFPAAEALPEGIPNSKVPRVDISCFIVFLSSKRAPDCGSAPSSVNGSAIAVQWQNPRSWEILEAESVRQCGKDQPSQQSSLKDLDDALEAMTGSRKSSGTNQQLTSGCPCAVVPQKNGFLMFPPQIVEHQTNTTYRRAGMLQ